MTIALTDQFDQDILALVNQERSSRGLGILTLSQKLDTAADLHAQDMATNYYATNHTGSDSSTTATRITRSGYEWTSIGENLAAGYTSASSVVQAWMNSTGHRANILNPNFTDLGLGYTYLSGTGGTSGVNGFAGTSGISGTGGSAGTSGVSGANSLSITGSIGGVGGVNAILFTGPGVTVRDRGTGVINIDIITGSNSLPLVGIVSSSLQIEAFGFGPLSGSGNQFRGNQGITGSLKVTGQFTASMMEGFTYVGGADGT
jgi:hypothetical protein